MSGASASAVVASPSRTNMIQTPLPLSGSSLSASGASGASRGSSLPLSFSGTGTGTGGSVSISSLVPGRGRIRGRRDVESVGSGGGSDIIRERGNERDYHARQENRGGRGGRYLEDGSLASASVSVSVSELGERGEREQRGRGRVYGSWSIHAHAEKIMEVIREEREGAVRGVVGEVEMLRRELENVWEEMGTDGVDPALPSGSGSGSFAAAAGSSGGGRGVVVDDSNGLSAHPTTTQLGDQITRVKEDIVALRRTFRSVVEGYRKKREEWERVKGENEELKNLRDLRSPNRVSPTADINSGQEVGEVGDIETLRRRYEELERENERLKKSEATLLERIEIFESLNASATTTLEAIDNLPDLNSVIETLRKGSRLGLDPSTTPYDNNRAAVDSLPDRSNLSETPRRRHQLGLDTPSKTPYDSTPLKKREYTNTHDYAQWKKRRTEETSSR